MLHIRNAFKGEHCCNAPALQVLYRRKQDEPKAAEKRGLRAPFAQEHEAEETTWRAGRDDHQVMSGQFGHVDETAVGRRSEHEVQRAHRARQVRLQDVRGAQQVHEVRQARLARAEHIACSERRAARHLRGTDARRRLERVRYLAEPAGHCTGSEYLTYERVCSLLQSATSIIAHLTGCRRLLAARLCAPDAPGVAAPSRSFGVR